MNPFAALAVPLAHRPGDVQPEPPRLRIVASRPAKPPRESTITPIPNPWHLSGMQCEILKRLVDGDSSSEIGEAFCLSRKTIEIHLERARVKMNARNRLQVAVMWVRHAMGAPA
jgi:DNA-binding CsgD family transcriptional regulator